MDVEHQATDLAVGVRIPRGAHPNRWSAALHWSADRSKTAGLRPNCDHVGGTPTPTATTCDHERFSQSSWVTSGFVRRSLPAADYGARIAAAQFDLEPLSVAAQVGTKCGVSDGERLATGGGRGCPECATGQTARVPGKLSRSLGDDHNMFEYEWMRPAGNPAPFRKLTGAERRVFEAVRWLIARGGLSPILQEIADYIGLRRWTIHSHLVRLKATGLVDWDPHRPRSLRVTTDPDLLAMHGFDPSPYQRSAKPPEPGAVVWELPKQPTTKLPVLGPRQLVRSSRPMHTGTKMGRTSSSYPSNSLVPHSTRSGLRAIRWRDGVCSTATSRLSISGSRSGKTMSSL